VGTDAIDELMERACPAIRYRLGPELLARVSVVSSVPGLARQAEVLGEMPDAGGGRYTQRLSHPYFRQWGAYSGLMLEEDWRSARRRQYDLTFGSLQMLFH
jgi:hypothetical protein